MDWVIIKKVITRFSQRFHNNLKKIEEASGSIISGSMQKWDSWVKNAASSTISEIKSDISWNQEFLKNLSLSLETFQQSLGKGDIYVKRIESADATKDALYVSRSGSESSYPAKYNADNAFAVQNGFSNAIYSIQWLQLLDRNGQYSIYYQARNKDGNRKWVLVNLTQWSSIMIDNLKPLLYYKNRYLFSVKEAAGLKSLFAIDDANNFVTLGGRSLGWYAIDWSILAFQDTDAHKIYFLSLDDLKITKSFALQKQWLWLEWFVKKWDYVWMQYKDNLTQKMRYEKRKW